MTSSLTCSWVLLCRDNVLVPHALEPCSQSQATLDGVQYVWAVVITRGQHSHDSLLALTFDLLHLEKTAF